MIPSPGREHRLAERQVGGELLGVAAEAAPVLDLDDVEGVGLFGSDERK
jgi:hypothetical protein